MNCPCAKSVLVDMAYSMGQMKFKAMHSFNMLIGKGRWEEAADELVLGS